MKTRKTTIGNINWFLGQKMTCYLYNEGGYLVCYSYRKNSRRVPCFVVKPKI